MALTKADMAEKLYEELGLNKREAKELVEAFFEEVRAALEAGDQVKLSGFGNFDLRNKNGKEPQDWGGNPDLCPPGGDFPSGTEAQGAGRGVCWSRRQVATSPRSPGSDTSPSVR